MLAWLPLPTIQDWAGSVIDDVVAYGKGSDPQIPASKLLHSYVLRERVHGNSCSYLVFLICRDLQLPRS